MLRTIQLVSVLALSCSITACAGLLDSNEPPEKTYWLEPLIVSQATVPDRPRPSLTLTVSAAPGLDTDRLLILGPGARLNFYAAARWPDHFPEVLASLLQTTLESTERYSRVMASPSSRATDWTLELEVRELFTVTKAPEFGPVVRIVLRGYVNCAESDAAIAIQTDVGVDDSRLSNIVAGYQQALREISQQLLVRLADSCDVTDAQASVFGRAQVTDYARSRFR